jgi:hypothetical protein
MAGKPFFLPAVVLLCHLPKPCPRAAGKAFGDARPPRLWQAVTHLYAIALRGGVLQGYESLFTFSNIYFQ